MQDGSESPVVETVEEKVKDVICKTVTNIPLQSDQVWTVYMYYAIIGRSGMDSDCHNM